MNNILLLNIRIEGVRQLTVEINLKIKYTAHLKIRIRKASEETGGSTINFVTRTDQRT
jgi:hypothetical protein